MWANWIGDPRVKLVNNAAALLLGPVLGVVLRLRGTISLHGCVLEVESRSLVLLGEAGVGKSTIAAALAQRGNPVLSDDVAAIAERPAMGWIAQPGYPRLRLRPATLDALGARASESGPVMTGVDKRYLELDAGEGSRPWRFQPEPLPVGAIYELRRDPELASPVVERVTGADRLMTLIRRVRAAAAPLHPPARSDEFARLSRLAVSVPIRRLRCPDDLAALPAVCRTIVDDATSGARGG